MGNREIATPATQPLSPMQKTVVCDEFEALLTQFILAVRELIAIQCLRPEGPPCQLVELVERKRATAKQAIRIHLERHPDCGI
jgi:hypothetical protein